MGSTKRKLEELSIIDNFLMDAVASDETINEDFFREIISVLLNRKVGKIRIRAQSIKPPTFPTQRGIRLDVEVLEEGIKPEDETVTEGVDSEANGSISVKNIYDLEPHKKKDKNLPRRSRFYQAKIDSRQLKSGGKDFSKLPDLYVIIILDYDPFGYDYMQYSIHNTCGEVAELEYNDGLYFYYFYPKGKKGGSTEIKNLLEYILNSREENVVDETTRKIHEFIEKIRHRQEMEEAYMTWDEYIYCERQEEREEVTRETAIKLIKGGKLTPEEISDCVSILSVEDVIELKKSLT